jgi:hypothetical protein
MFSKQNIDPLATEVRAVNLGPLSQATDLTLIQGLYKLDAAARENRCTFTLNYLLILHNEWVFFLIYLLDL